MKFYCTIKNTGYGEVVDMDNEDGLNISLLFSNDIVKTFRFDIAYGRSLFDNEHLELTDDDQMLKALKNEISTGKYDEKIKARLDKKITRNGELLYELLKSKYKFGGFMHETTINNLVSILVDSKLKPREVLTTFEDSANNAIINQTSDNVKKCVRFYFYQGTPTNYRFDQKRPNEMVYIALKWDLIYVNGAMLVNGNASSKYSESKPAREYLRYWNPDDNFMDWNRIFHRYSLPSDDECHCYPNGFEDKNDIVRKRNAEINIPNSVSTNYIEKIVFRNADAYNRFIKRLNNDIILKEFVDRIVIDENYFY